MVFNKMAFNRIGACLKMDEKKKLDTIFTDENQYKVGEKSWQSGKHALLAVYDLEVSEYF